MSNQTPCPGCDGHECEDECQYPGVARETTTERDRFEKAWAKRPWTEGETDKDRAWRWWQAALAVDPVKHSLPGHDETMASLDALTIRPGVTR